MSIVQKLVVDKTLTNNIQIVVRDETGVFNPSNDTGYIGGYDNVYNIEKYIFELINVFTGEKYIQIQSNDLNNPNEYYNPSVERIINKENVTIDSDNFGLDIFNDGVYKLSMTVKTTHSFYGQGYVNQNVITNVPGAITIFQEFGYVVVDNDVYKIIDVVDSTLILDKHLKIDITEFVAGIKTTTNFILSDNLNICINKAIADFADNCNCEQDVKTINILSELQLYMWGLQKAVDRDDIIASDNYLKLAKSLCNSLNCGCDGR